MNHNLSQPRYENCPAQGVRWHEFSLIFPDMEREAFDALVNDIRQNGVSEPIVMLGREILDGRHRYQAARQLGIEYPVVDYWGDDPLGFVLLKNLARRHLTESQRAMVASKLANIRAGEVGRNHERSERQICLPEAAGKLNVSERSVRSARAVREQSPELAAKVESGALSVSLAEKVARLPEEVRTPVIDAPAEETKVVAREAVRRASLHGGTSDAAPVDQPVDLGGRTSKESARVRKFLDTLRSTAKRLEAQRLEEVLPLVNPKEAEEICGSVGRIGAFCRAIDASRVADENASPADVREPAHA